MSIKRIQARISSVSKLHTAFLQYHELRFHKVSNNDGSAKCDAKETGNEDHFIIGVVFDVPDEEKIKLDEIEGLGFGYEEKTVSVELQNGEIVEVFTYYATNIDPNLKPLHWYKEHVLIGARENGLPEEYIKKIEIVESISDADVARHEKELSIYLLKKKKCLVDPEG